MSGRRGRDDAQGPATSGFALPNGQIGAATGVPVVVTHNTSLTGNPVTTLQGAGSGTPNYFQTNMNSGDPGDFYPITYQRVSGDFEFVVRAGTGSLLAKGQIGITVREDLSEASRGVAVFYSPESTANQPNDPTPRDLIQMTCRLVAGIKSAFDPSLFKYQTAIPNPQARPYCWFKIARVGNNVGAYWSRDGHQWIPIASNSGSPVILPTNLYAGMFVAGNDQSTPVTGSFDNIYIGNVRQQWMSTWMGNSFAQTDKGNLNPVFVPVLADGFVSTDVQSIWVDTDGTVYTGSRNDELGQTEKIYKDGRVVKTLVDNTHFGNKVNNEGGVAGNAANVYWYAHISGRVILRSNKAGIYQSTISTTNPIGTAGITGMCCSSAANHELYISDYTNNRILVVDTATNLELTGRAFAFTQGRPGPIAVDSRGDLWIIQEPVDSPIFQKYTAQYATGVYKYSRLGVDSGQAITNVTFPTDVAVSPIADEVWVTDNGPNQQIRIYNGLAAAPVLNRTFGITGGIYAGATPGAMFDQYAGGWNRLYSLTGVGFDALGNPYIACDGRGTDLRKYDTAGNLVWQLHASLDCFCGPDFDSGTDGADAYGLMLHHQLDLTKTAPGTEWSLKSFTYNPFTAYTDPRYPDKSAVPIARTLSGNRFLFMSVTGSDSIFIFRFSGEIAVPCGRVTTVPNPTPPGKIQLWVDANGDGIEQPGEITERFAPVDQTGSVAAMYWDVDSHGDIWWLVNNRVTHLVFQSVNAAGAAVYSLAGAAFEEPLWPEPFKFENAKTAEARSLRYDRAHDAMYMSGNTDTLVAGTSGGVGQFPIVGAVICRFDNWSTRLAAATARYTIILPTEATDGGNWFTQKLWVDDPAEIRPFFKTFTQAGDYVFAWEEFNQIRVYDARLGNYVMSLGPGPEINSQVSWIDPGQARVLQRANGEYLVVFQDSGSMAHNLFYRWTPTRPTYALPTAPINLVATGDNGLIRLAWEGPKGFIDSFKVYRTIGAGAEAFLATAYASAYTDTTAPLGQAITYRITAVNNRGEGAYSASAVGHVLAASATFVAIDTTTQGTWKGVYGGVGNYLVGGTNNLPAYTFISGDGIKQDLLAPGSTDVRGLTTPGVGVTTRQLARWYKQDNTGFIALNIDFSILDGSTRQLAVYCVAWNASGESQTMIVRDAVTGATLDSRVLSSFDSGKWVVYNISGHVTITASPLAGGLGEVNGFFLG